MTMKEIDALQSMIASKSKISEKELFDFAYKANDEHKCYMIAIKILNSHYKKWYDESIKQYPDIYKETLDEETMYITTTDNKAFKHGMGGYSIFAESIAMKKRNARGIMQSSIDRIEHAPIEYAVILNEVK